MRRRPWSRHIRAKHGLMAVIFGYSAAALAQAGPSAPTPLASAPSALGTSASVPSAAVPAVVAPASPPTVDTEPEGCRDDWPGDRARPQLVETFPKRGQAGY